MGTLPLWVGFNLFVLIALILDLGVFHRKAHKIGIREALLASGLWFTLALGFGFFIWHSFGAQRGLEYLTGYVIEKALSVDNLFLFLVIFRAFAVDEKLQHRLLEWGIVGALIMRGAMIAAGAGLIERFSWVLYVFGAFLVFAGLHMLFAKKAEMHPEENRISRFARKYLRVTKEYEGSKFFVRNGGKLFATPLFVALLIVEITDITLAVDSIPAIFGITRDPFIVYTSNVFAILGLRAMYFLLAGVLGRLRYLTTGLSFVLTFIGAKMIAEPWVHISVEISLGIVAGILLVALASSLLVGTKAKA
jgi:tellurite resistance protein TerC